MPELDIESIAIEAQHDELAQWLHRARHFTPLHMACESRRPDLVLRLLRAGANSSVAVRGETPLDVASRQSHLPLSLPVCDKTVALIKAALQPWSPRTHSLAPREAQCSVARALLVLSLLRDQPGIPTLSNELHLLLLSYVPLRAAHRPS
jgi:hypothetical protein